MSEWRNTTTWPNWGLSRTSSSSAPTWGSSPATIRSADCGDHYEITVADDGPGLAAGDGLGDGERSHVGLRNARERLALVCGGKLLLQSEPGAGVTATIVIPKEQTK